MAGNIYNINETKVILLILGSVKVLIGKDNRRDYRDTRIKRIIVTVIKYISANGRYLKSIII